MQKSPLIPQKFVSPSYLSGLPDDTPVLVGFSGGADSSALLRMLCEYREMTGAPIYAAHINHGIRGAEADRDQAFCQQVADSLGVRLFVLNADVPLIANERKMSIETAAREVRYEFFEKIMAENSIPLLATAHNANDNFETMLFNMVRGCGLNGACGIPDTRPLEGGTLIRPILKLTKPEILEYCEKNGIDYVTDSTNTDTDYTRNKIRNQIIPLLEEINPSATENATKLSASLKEDSLCLQSMAKWFLDEMRDDTSIETEKICGSPASIANRAIIELYGELADESALERVHIDAIRHLAEKNAPHSSLNLPCGVFVTVEKGRLVFSKEPLNVRPEIEYEAPLSEGKNSISQTNCEIIIEQSQNKKNVYKNSILLYIDSAKICGTLHARPRMAGDKIRIGNMSKSLKKLFCDKKISLELRSRIPVICDSLGIVAVPLVGVSDKVRPQADTQNVISLEIHLN